MKILFCDIDGTLTTTHSGDAFKRDANDVKVIEGAAKSVKRYADKGWTIIGISNQDGCNKETGKPFKTIQQIVDEMHRTMELIPEIDVIYFCPNFAGNLVVNVFSERFKYLNGYLIDEYNVSEFGRYPNFRKPSHGMIVYAVDNIRSDAASEEITVDIDLKECWLVGDREEDEQCAINAGINFCPANLFQLSSAKLPD